jgi:hypothetical protein
MLLKIGSGYLDLWQCVNMPATSVKQRNFMAVVMAYKEGKIKNPSKSVIDAAHSMTRTKVKEFIVPDSIIAKRKKLAAYTA